MKSKALRWFLVILGLIAILIATITLNIALGWPLWPGVTLAVVFFFVVTRPKKQDKEK